MLIDKRAPINIINKMIGCWKRRLSANMSRHGVASVQLLSSFQDNKNLGDWSSKMGDNRLFSSKASNITVRSMRMSV